MRTFKLMAVLFFLITACSESKISKEEAEQILKIKYPRAIDMYIYGGDPKYAKMLQEAGLDSEGYVSIKKSKKLGDGSGWVTFNEKALPYILETSESEKKDLVQKLKAAEEQLSEITTIEQDDDNGTAEITYTTKVTGLTPFARLIKLKEGEVKQRKAYAIKYYDEWRLKEKNTK